MTGRRTIKKDMRFGEIFVDIVISLFWQGLRNHPNTLICSFVVACSSKTLALQYLDTNIFLAKRYCRLSTVFPSYILVSFKCFNAFYTTKKFHTISYHLGYVYTGSDLIGSDPFRIGSTMVRIHSVSIGLVRNWNSKVPYGITFISGPI